MTFVSSEGDLIIAEDDQIQTWNRQTDETRPFGEIFDECAMGVAVSPDGETCVTGHDAGIIRFWSCQSGRVTRTLTGHTDKVERVRFSPDGLLLATGSWDGTMRLWEAGTGKLLVVLNDGLTEDIEGIAFSPDGAAVAAVSRNSNGAVWDSATGQRRYE
ncbi:MAG TPA: hypothetical protein EYQ63_14335, partial [Fuerstia sp.]|nr:hypothetical protein [Fuerstiella sp.]